MNTILVIDDDPPSRYLVKAILEREGYRVWTAGGGDEGLRLFHSHAIDLVITDVLMPGTDGLAVIRDLLSTAPDSKIIALSGGGMMLSAETSLHVACRLGAVNTLAKPFVPAELLAMVRRLLHGEPASATMTSQKAVPA